MLKKWLKVFKEIEEVAPKSSFWLTSMLNMRGQQEETLGDSFCSYSL